MNYSRLFILLILGFFLSYDTSVAQCESWNQLSNKEELEGDHSIYRQSMKSKDYANAFPYWEKVYKAAPVADGLRDFHFMDGVTLYKDMLSKTTDEENKKDIKTKIIALYDQCVECYESKSIQLSNCNDDDCYQQKMGYLLGRKAYDMFYNLNSSYSQNLMAFEESVKHAGNESEYIVLVPYATIAVYQFKNDKLTKEQTREIHKTLNEIADYNTENNSQYSSQYGQAKEAMNSVFSQIERDIFDCEYFKEKMWPEYVADSDNPDVIKKVLAILKGQGCEPGDEFYDELDGKWKEYAAEENARIQSEFEAANPHLLARRFYEEEKFAESVEKYKEAIELAEDQEQKSQYYFSIASILFRKLDSYNEARRMALEAAKLRPNWGRPIMLIGDMYGATARSCGDDWNQRLAILAAMEKYAYARSIDSEVADEANDRLSKYRASMPLQDEGFMRGIKEGARETVGCWIGETVTVQYRQ